MFTAFIVQPLFNLLVLIYGLLPGHNFGLAIIIFTIVIRILLWPLVKRQLHQTKAMRALQPQLKRIKKEAKGDKRKEQMMIMELYKERGINPFATFPILIIQFVVLIGLYYGLMKIIKNPHEIVTFTYPFIQNLSWLGQLGENIQLFDNTLLGLIDLHRAAIGPSGFYLPAFLLVVGSAVAQYYQAKQLMPDDKDQRSLKTILKEASTGKQADQSEVNAAVGRSTRYMIPAFILIFTIGLPAALSLYWLTSGLVAFWQQDRILRQDETEMEALADKPSKNVAEIPEAEIVSKPKTKAAKPKKHKKKRRKK